MAESAEKLPHPLDAFDLHAGTTVALVGAGGKSSLMFALGRHLRIGGMTSVLTTTTRLWAWQQNCAAHVCHWPEDMERVPAVLTHFGSCLLVGETVGDKVLGIPTETVAELAARQVADVILVEADGARGMAIKAPAAHEPPIPPNATTVILVVSITALDGPLGVVAFRPNLIFQLLSYSLHEILTVQSVAQLLAHEHGGRKNAPADAVLIAFINQIQTPEQRLQAELLSDYLMSTTHFNRVILGNTRLPNPVMAVSLHH